MKLEKVAIVKDGKDIGRIIPFNSAGDEYDFKMSFSKNNYGIYIYKFLSNKPEKQLIDDSSEWEISYHRSTRSKPTIIHLKGKRNQPEYKVLPLKRIIDPDINNEFPIPFMRIEIPRALDAKDYKSKNSKEHVLFDMEGSNVAEFYLTNAKFDYEKFSQKWPTISFRLIASSFEYFATNNVLTDSQKYKYFMPKDEETRVAAVEFDLNKDMKFHVNLYNNPEFDSEEIKVTFIENEYAHALLGLSPIGYENEHGKVEMRPAYLEDLSRETMSSEEMNKWKYRFNRMETALLREIKKVEKSKKWWEK